MPGEFTPSAGWDGFDRWFEVAESKIPENLREQAFHYLKGLAYGYPDSAIEGLLGSAPDPMRVYRSVKTVIPYSDYLSTGQPNFMVLPEDIDSPDVQHVCHEWGEFLEDFYTHPIIVARLKQEAFLQQRQKVRDEIKFGRTEFWRRGEQLGDPLHFESPLEKHLTVADEQVLRDSIQELEKLVDSGAPPHEWVRFLQQRNLTGKYGGWITPQKVQTWFWFGAYGHVEYRRRFYHAVITRHPDFLPAVLRHETEALLLTETDQVASWSAYF